MPELIMPWTRPRHFLLRAAFLLNIISLIISSIGVLLLIAWLHFPNRVHSANKYIPNFYWVQMRLTLASIKYGGANDSNLRRLEEFSQLGMKNTMYKYNLRAHKYITNAFITNGNLKKALLISKKYAEISNYDFHGKDFHLSLLKTHSPSLAIKYAKKLHTTYPDIRKYAVEYAKLSAIDDKKNSLLIINSFNFRYVYQKPITPADLL